MSNEGTKKFKHLTAEIVSLSMDKTLVVSVAVVKPHPLYRKRYTTHKKCYVDIDETSKEKCSLGDKVLIRQHKPLSKTKKRTFVEKLA